MFQSPFGGVSMFLNILVVLIGKCTSAVSKRSSFVRRAARGFFSPFIVISNDTVIRRVFAVSIPFTMSMMVLAAIASSFVVLFQDEKRIPIYELPSRTYTAINNPEYLTDISLRELFVPSILLPKDESRDAAPSTAKESSAAVFDTLGENQVLYSSSTVTGSTTEPHQSTFGGSTLLLVKFLRDHNIDPSIESRVALASFLNIRNYTGDEKGDLQLLTKLQALTAPSSEMSQQARN
jgi:hypothetical protein